METRSNSAVAQVRYASETGRRMAHVVRGLQAGPDKTDKRDDVVCRLRRQERAAQRMGFAGIARLCEALADYLTEAGANEPHALSESRPPLLEVCRVVQRHAETVGKGPTNGSSDV